MTIRSLSDLQNWVNERQHRKSVGILTSIDVNDFWNTQEVLEKAISDYPNVKAFLYIKPKTTWSEYNNNTIYKGPFYSLQWLSNGQYRCERNDSEHKYWDKIDEDEKHFDFYGYLMADNAYVNELFHSTIQCWKLCMKFDVKYYDKTDKNNSIFVKLSRKSDNSF